MKNLQAGFARLDITPPLGVCLEGYFFERRAEGVLDPLYINAVAFKAGNKTAVIVCCDLCQLETEILREWIPQIADKAGVPADAVFVCCTHTHTGPVICGTREPSDPLYDSWLLRRMSDAAVMALRDSKSVKEVLAYEGQCKGVTFPRRLKMKNGHYQTWGITQDPNIESFASPGDDSLRFVRIVRDGADEIVLVNFQTHPDHVSGNLYSGDFPAFLRNGVETRRPGTKCVFLNGAQGQMIIHDYIQGSIKLPKYVRSQWAGGVLSDYVLEHFDEATPVDGVGVTFGRENLRFRTKRDPNRLAEAEKIIDIHENGDEEKELGPDWIATPLVTEAYILRDLEQRRLDYIDIPISAVTVGGLAFLGIAGEPFCEIGMAIRMKSPYPVTFVCCLTNGSEGYYPTAEAYDQGGYEPRGTRYPKGIGEALIESGLCLLHKLSGQAG